MTERMINRLRKEVLSTVIHPALQSESLDQAIKNKVKNTEIWINQATHIGDLFDYLKNILANRRETNQKVYSELKSKKLVPIEDFVQSHLSKYEEFSSIKLINDLKEGGIYSGHQISYMSKNYDTRTGISILKALNGIQAVFSKVNFSGEKYDNSWIEEGIVLKHAMYGYGGVQKLDTDYNSAILNSDGYPVHIFIKMDTKYRYHGTFKCLGYLQEEGKLYFKLKKVGTRPELESFSSISSTLELELEKSQGLSIADRIERLGMSSKLPEVNYVKTKVYKRNPDVIVEVLRRANGVCERCGRDAPFKRAKDNSPYLEVHHKIQLSKGGEDTLENAIGLCPNCHREMHFGFPGG